MMADVAVALVLPRAMAAVVGYTLDTGMRRTLVWKRRTHKYLQ
jgi:hypothetical protein